MKFTQDDLDAKVWFAFSEIHAVLFYKEKCRVIFDLDYTYKVEPSEQEGGAFKMWKAPATLTFFDCAKIEMDVHPIDYRIELDGLARSAMPARDDTHCKLWEWIFDSPRGNISLWASGFVLEFREEPKLVTDYPYVGKRLVTL